MKQAASAQQEVTCLCAAIQKGRRAHVYFFFLNHARLAKMKYIFIFVFILIYIYACI